MGALPVRRTVPETFYRAERTAALDQIGGITMADGQDQLITVEASREQWNGFVSSMEDLVLRLAEDGEMESDESERAEAVHHTIYYAPSAVPERESSDGHVRSITLTRWQWELVLAELRGSEPTYERSGDVESVRLNRSCRELINSALG